MSLNDAIEARKKLIEGYKAKKFEHIKHQSDLLIEQMKQKLVRDTNQIMQIPFDILENIGTEEIRCGDVGDYIEKTINNNDIQINSYEFNSDEARRYQKRCNLVFRYIHNEKIRNEKIFH